MTYSEAYLKLEQAGQTHLLAFYDTLTEEEQERLLTQIEKTDLSVTRYIGRKDQLQKWTTIAPLPALEIPAIEAERDRFERIGLEAIRRGEAAAVLLAGGMGTRLGSDAPKCMYDIGLTRHVYIMQRLIENLREVTDRAGAEIPFLIMTSDRNHEQTVSFMEEHDFFGYPKEKVVFFRQDWRALLPWRFLPTATEAGSNPWKGQGSWLGSRNRASNGSMFSAWTTYCRGSRIPAL